MIAKQAKGADFYGVLKYNQGKVEKGYGVVLETNLTSEKVVMQTKEFNVVRQLRPNLSKAVYHTSLSLPYSDSLSDKEFTDLGRDYLKDMGFDDNQYIIYKHTDQDHSHIHIVANRVKYSGDVVSDSQDYKRSEALVRKLEVKYNLTVLKENKESNVLSKGEIEKCLRTGEAPERLELQRIINEIIKHNQSIFEFEKKLKEKKVSIKLNASIEGKISGISFEYKGNTYKGSQVNRNLSWSKLKTKLYEQNRIDPIILQNTGKIRENQQEARRVRKTSESNSFNYSQQPKTDLGENRGAEKVNKPRIRRRR
ncbi:relaxase/mobilization nuclease domain-containing protein [Flavobacterium haoranii]|uniref:Relaxase/Mobilisation nuclease domain-containing protein n=1 Tax=Flavobacterium haoranii TaxID=683124 RepID=A0A1M6BDS2_9FLAO|nr:relaxase/mobilization nuclease domain-containing protein [Flavobacterium haoranii]SHI46593.1 Relaxase/Mobilisation nuclease domain-containing protein [Flavobacterium haoranii]